MTGYRLSGTKQTEETGGLSLPLVWPFMFNNANSDTTLQHYPYGQPDVVTNPLTFTEFKETGYLYKNGLQSIYISDWSNLYQMTDNLFYGANINYSKLTTDGPEYLELAKVNNDGMITSLSNSHRAKCFYIYRYIASDRLYNSNIGKFNVTNPLDILSSRLWIVNNNAVYHSSNVQDPVINNVKSILLPLNIIDNTKKNAIYKTPNIYMSAGISAGSGFKVVNRGATERYSPVGQTILRDMDILYITSNSSIETDFLPVRHNYYHIDDTNREYIGIEFYYFLSEGIRDE